MKPGTKYEPLYEHLRRSGKDEVRLTFAQIEKLIDSELPESARQSRAFWSNRSSGALQASAWMEAGYHVMDVDLEEERVTFSKPATAYKVRRKDGEIVWDSEAIQALRQHMRL